MTIFLFACFSYTLPFCDFFTFFFINEIFFINWRKSVPIWKNVFITQFLEFFLSHIVLTNSFYEVRTKSKISNNNYSNYNYGELYKCFKIFWDDIELKTQKNRKYRKIPVNIQSQQKKRYKKCEICSKLTTKTSERRWRRW